MMLKIFPYLFLLGTFIAPIFVSSKSEDIHKILSSKNPAERIVALQDLKQTADQTLHQKMIEMALWDTDLEVRLAAENTLNNLVTMDTVLSGVEMGKYLTELNTDIQRLRAKLSSVVPDEQIKALKSIKGTEILHPALLYTLIKEVVLRPTDSRVKKELMRIAVSNSYFQRWLMFMATADVISRDARTTAKDILIGIKPGLENQRELVRIATSNNISNKVKFAAGDILMRTRIYPEIQYKLVRIATSEIDSDARGIATFILKKANPDHELAEMAKPFFSDTDAHRKADIYFSLNLYPAVQKQLVHMATDHSGISDTVRDRATDILLFNDSIDTSPFNDMNRGTRFLLLEIQEELVRIATFYPTQDTHGELYIENAKKARKYARKILARTRSLYPEVSGNMNFSFRCKMAFRKFGLFFRLGVTGP